MDKLSIYIHPHIPKHNELLGACKSISSQTLEETGCMDCHLINGRGEDRTISIEQYWRERHLLDDYLQSDLFSALLGAMKLLAKRYELTINDCSPYEAMILLNWIRNKT